MKAVLWAFFISTLCGVGLAHPAFGKILVCAAVAGALYVVLKYPRVLEDSVALVAQGLAGATIMFALCLPFYGLRYAFQ
jgi:hypothetical protein